jgi:hypothetical protein
LRIVSELVRNLQFQNSRGWVNGMIFPCSTGTGTGNNLFDYQKCTGGIADKNTTVPVGIKLKSC